MGTRTAELMETSVMLVVTILAARWVTRRFSPSTPAGRLGVGFIAVGFLLVTEFTLESTPPAAIP